MDRLIREMSYLFTKAQFEELQERAHEIAVGYSDHLECFGFIADAIEEYIETLPRDECREHEKILMHYMAMRAITLWGEGKKITAVQWAHPGWFGTAEKGETIQ